MHNNKSFCSEGQYSSIRFKPVKKKSSVWKYFLNYPFVSVIILKCSLIFNYVTEITKMCMTVQNNLRNHLLSEPVITSFYVFLFYFSDFYLLCN